MNTRNPTYHRRREERLRLADAQRGQWKQREAFLAQVRTAQADGMAAGLQSVIEQARATGMALDPVTH